MLLCSEGPGAAGLGWEKAALVVGVRALSAEHGMARGVPKGRPWATQRGGHPLPEGAGCSPLSRS